MKKAIHVKIKPSLEQFYSEKKKELKGAVEALQMDVTFKYAERILSLDETLRDLYCHGVTSPRVSWSSRNLSFTSSKVPLHLWKYTRTILNLISQVS